MVRTCCICKIDHGAIENVTLHGLPKKEEFKKKWFENIGREVGRYSAVCSQHFEEKDFCYKIIGGIVKRFLIPTAVPSFTYQISCGNVQLSIPDVQVNTEQTNRDSDNVSQATQNINNNIVNNTASHNSLQSSLELEHCEEYRNRNNVDSDKVTKASTSKRVAQQPLRSAKRYCNARYIGDLRRNDFTSNNSWEMVKNFVEDSRKKQKVLHQKVQRLNKKVESLKSLLDYIKQKMKPALH